MEKGSHTVASYEIKFTVTFSWSHTLQSHRPTPCSWHCHLESPSVSSYWALDKIPKCCDVRIKLRNYERNNCWSPTSGFCNVSHYLLLCYFKEDESLSKCLVQPEPGLLYLKVSRHLISIQIVSDSFKVEGKKEKEKKTVLLSYYIYKYYYNKFPSSPQVD